MSSTSFPNLNSFNRLVLEYQDEAYTLAYTLLGGEEQASQVVQEAIQQIFPRFKNGDSSFREQVLQLVAKGCQGKPGVHQELSELQGRYAQLCTLPMNEKLAVALVDVLGLNYEEASRVLGSSIGRVAKLLANGRRRLCTSYPPAPTAE